MLPDHDQPAPADSTSSAARPPVRPSNRVLRRTGIGILALLSLFFGGYWFILRHQPSPDHTEDPPTANRFPPDPRLAYSGPFRNVHPEVKYVGDGECMECHNEIARTYRNHPMGRSLVPVAKSEANPPTDRAHHNPFEAFDILFRVDQQRGRMWQRQTRLDASGKPIYDFAHEVDYIIGSGMRGHSYLTVREGFVMQTPVSWFSQKQVWDLSPGFPPWARAGRLVQGACLYCHTNHVEPVENTRNRYREPVFDGHAIGCERCHGPGERHVQSWAKDDIVNPRRLDVPLREAVCQQCHLEGATRVQRRGRGLNDFRPGMPLEAFYTVYVRGPGLGETNKAVNHVEQMYQSLCFLRTSGDKKLGCISCHNPHEAVPPDQRVNYYRQRCLQCHAEHGCKFPAEKRLQERPDDSCVACHMPRSATEDIVHTASTDHRILRKRGEEPTNRHGSEPLPDLPLLDFHRGVPNLNDTDRARDLGMALFQLHRAGMPLTGPDGEFAIRLLTQGLNDCPGDVDAWEAKGKILQTLRRPAAAIEAFETLLKRAPSHEGALVTLGTIHRDLGHPERALPYWRRAVEVNPWVAEYRRNLVMHLAARNQWEELRPHCHKWLDLDPASVEARRYWTESLLRSGRRQEAEAEFARIRALRPPDLATLEAWFAEQTR